MKVTRSNSGVLLPFSTLSCTVSLHPPPQGRGMACSASFGRSAIVTARGDVYVMECYSRTTVKTFPGHIRQVVAHVRGATYVTDDSRVHDPRDIIAFSGLGHVPVLMVACGKEHTAALSESGHVFTFGRGCEGQLGRGAGTHDESPAFLQPDKFADERIVFIACGDYFTAALSAARVYTWGNNRFGQLGLGTVVPSTVPQRVDALAFGASAPVFLAAGQDFMAAVTPDGSMYTWGCNRHGQLGRGFDDRVATPQRVWFVLKDPEAQREPAVMAACGNAHTLLLTTKGEVFASGMGRAGQLGLGDNWQRHWFQRVCVGASGGQEVATVAADLNVSMAVTRSGDVYQWGWCLEHTRVLDPFAWPASKVDGQRAGRWHFDDPASALAFVLGTHERLGADSPVCFLAGETGLLEMIVGLWWYKVTRRGVPEECVGLQRLLGFREGVS